MIRVIRTDGVEILLNTNLIKSVSSGKDMPTTIVLNSGEEIFVKTPAFDVAQKIKAYVSGLTQERRDYDRGGKDPEKDQEKEKPSEKEKPQDKDKDKNKEQSDHKDKPRDREGYKGKDRSRDNRDKDNKYKKYRSKPREYDNNKHRD